VHGTAEPRRRAGATAAALAGALGAALALGVDELLAGVAGRPASLLVSVGDLVVDSAPGGAIRFGIATLGERNKPTLLVAIVACCLLIGAVGVGAARARRPSVIGP
jgi:hypothetical protein